MGHGLQPVPRAARPMTAPEETRPKSENSTSRATTNAQTDERQAILDLLDQRGGWTVEETIVYQLRLQTKTVNNHLEALQEEGELWLIDVEGYTVVVDGDRCLGRAMIQFGARLNEVRNR